VDTIVTVPYCLVGNITKIVDGVKTDTQTFGYDDLDRLTSAKATATTLGAYDEIYGYDSASGNLATKAGVTLNYNDAAHKHAVSSTSSGNVTVNSYDYDLNGNQTTRNIYNGTITETYNLAYDAENRLVEVKKGATSIANFTYDADGKRVKSEINGVTTLFVGSHYEITTSGSVQTISKYYFAGSQRVAMRQGGVLNYIVGDHLGSTSLVTDASGNTVSELRYKAWGEVRFNSGVSPTRYQYTGQYSNEPDFGLLFYNARWYDSQLGRFAQADSIVPPGVQGLDRYAAMANNPVRFSDPSGHCVVSGQVFDSGSSVCQNTHNGQDKGSNGVTLADFGITISGSWSSNHSSAVLLAAIAIGNKFAQTNGGTTVSAFRADYSGGVNITFGTANPEKDWFGKPTGKDYNHPDMNLEACAGVSSGGCTSSPTQIDFWSMDGDPDNITDNIYNIVHEFGHAYDYGHDDRTTLSRGILSRDALRSNPCVGCYIFQQHPPSMNVGNVEIQGELYGDSFVAWVFDAWNTNPFYQSAVNQAQGFMP
jgi:RHS repeat-associated protein